nr:helix-turn-helix domain-containing protein [Corynebacterium sp. HMSC05E07]
MAKKAGKYTGRKRSLTPEQVVDARKRIAAGESKALVARAFGITRPALYRVLEDSAER